MKILTRIGIGILLILLFGTVIAVADDQQTILSTHNNLRQKVGVLPLTWSPTLATQAKSYAETLKALDPPDPMPHKVAGENLAWTRPNLDWNYAMSSWVKEADNYKYEKFSTGLTNGKITGHYTQMIWANTKQVGCGVSSGPSKSGKYFYVCRYSPPGNIGGEFPYPFIFLFKPIHRQWCWMGGPGLIHWRPC